MPNTLSPSPETSKNSASQTEKTGFSSFSDIHIEIVDRILELETRMKIHEQDISKFYSLIQSMERRIGQVGKR